VQKGLRATKCVARQKVKAPKERREAMAAVKNHICMLRSWKDDLSNGISLGIAWVNGTWTMYCEKVGKCLL